MVINDGDILWDITDITFSNNILPDAKCGKHGWGIPKLNIHSDSGSVSNGGSVPTKNGGCVCPLKKVRRHVWLRKRNIPQGVPMLSNHHLTTTQFPGKQVGYRRRSCWSYLPYCWFIVGSYW